MVVGPLGVFIVMVMDAAFCEKVPLLRLYPPMYLGRLLVSVQSTFMQVAQLIIQTVLSKVLPVRRWQ